MDAGRLTGGFATIVMQEDVLGGEAGNVEVGPAIVVKIACGNAAHESLHGGSSRQRAFVELAMAVVEEQLAGMRMPGIARFIANEKIDPAVVVGIEPDGGKRRFKGE